VELENNFNTADELKIVTAGKEPKVPNLLVGAAILFGINLLVALFFYASPNVLAGTVRADDSSYAVAKTSPFEERVKDSRWKPRPVEKVRPVLEAAAPVIDPLSSDPAVQQDASKAATTSDYTNAFYQTDMGARPVTTNAASFAASIPRSSDLQ
jgi:hypothetical protein